MPSLPLFTLGEVPLFQRKGARRGVFASGSGREEIATREEETGGG